MIVLAGHVSAFYLEVTHLASPDDPCGHFQVALHAKGNDACGKRLLLLSIEGDDNDFRRQLDYRADKSSRLEKVLNYIISGLDNHDLLNICSGLYHAGKSRGKEEIRHDMRQMLGI